MCEWVSNPRGFERAMLSVGDRPMGIVPAGMCFYTAGNQGVPGKHTNIGHFIDSAKWNYFYAGNLSFSVTHTHTHTHTRTHDAISLPQKTENLLTVNSQLPKIWDPKDTPHLNLKRGVKKDKQTERKDKQRKP
jgi:hypothetical protein